MRKLSSLIWMLVIVVAAFLLYTVKYQVQTLRSQIEQTARELENEKQSLHVVAAEWAYLNRPQRLEALASKYLATSSITVDKIAEIDALPYPQKQDNHLATEGLQPASVTYQKHAGAAR